MIRKIFNFILPPDNWKFPVIIISGIATGILFHIFYASNAVSYLSDNPKTCVNCHVMAPEYATWQTSSHGRVASCNDCHVPQDNVIKKYLFKVSDGMRHAYIFTMRNEPQVIQIKEAGKNAVQSNCIRCHSNQIHPIAYRSINNRSIADDGRYCWDCHREVPHSKVHSLSSAPYARVPLLESSSPEWIKKIAKY